MITQKIRTIVGNLIFGSIDNEVERVQAELNKVERDVVMRFSRGNVSMQAGRFLTVADLERERTERVRYYQKSA